jgi:phage repressor protein C with HTH and peptisase S24 domain
MTQGREMARIALSGATQVAVEKSHFPGLGPRAYALTVDGDGLRPKFAKGDIVIVDPDRIPQPGDFVVLYGDAKIAAITEHDGHPGLFHAIIGKV